MKTSPFLFKGPEKVEGNSGFFGFFLGIVLQLFNFLFFEVIGKALKNECNGTVGRKVNELVKFINLLSTINSVYQNEELKAAVEYRGMRVSV